MGKKSKAKRQREEQQATLAVTGWIRENRLSYARRWGRYHASKFEQDGHYEWMASFLGGHRVVLEIGTGTAQGTKALLEKGHTVISIDENPECLKIAERFLLSEGYKVTYEPREEIRIEHDGYSIDYHAPESPLIEGGALLLEGDVLNDPELLAWLTKLPVDAVVCWLLGTHEARPHNTIFHSIKVGNPGEYRLRVQNRIYEIADKVLKPGGILHIVDRGEAPAEDESLDEDTLTAHRDQASVTTLEVESTDYRLYEEPTDPKALPMGLTLGLSGRMPTNYRPALVSITSRKPPNPRISSAKRNT